MATDRNELHELIDNLPEEQVAGALADVRRRLQPPRRVESRAFAWVGSGQVGNARTDNAERVDELLADGFGR